MEIQESWMEIRKMWDIRVVMQGIKMENYV